MTPHNESQIIADLTYIRDQVDELRKDVANLRERQAKTEERTGWIATAAGIGGGVLGAIGLRMRGH